MKKAPRRFMHFAAITIGVSVSILFILSEQVRGAGGLDSVSKVVEWTGMVFLPLFGLNLDLYPERNAKVAGIGMLGVHVVLMMLVYGSLPSLTYITITPLAVIEMFVLVIPFLKIRKRLDPGDRPSRRRWPPSL